MSKVSSLAAFKIKNRQKVGLPLTEQNAAETMVLSSRCLLILGLGVLLETTQASTITRSTNDSIRRRPKLFFMRRAEQESRRHLVSTTPSERQPKTRAGLLAESFEDALEEDSPDGCIDTECLLLACRKYSSVLKDMGQRQVASDLEGNLGKLEALYHATPPSRRKTVSVLLEYEKSLGTHGHGGRLKDPSGAMGLLWIRRSLACQQRMYTMLLENRAPEEAAVEAYRLELQPYHGWVLQKMALAKSVPSRQDTLSRIGGFEGRFGREEELTTVKDLHTLLSTWRPILDRCKQIYADLDIEDNSRVG